MKLPKVKKSKITIDKNSFMVLDVTNTSVKGLVFTQKDDKLTAVGVSKRDSYKDRIRKAPIRNVAEDCFLQAGVQSKEAIVGLSGPKVYGFLLITKFRREKLNKEISERELNQIYARVKKTSIKQARQRLNSIFADEVELEPLDLVVTSFVLDDKKVDEPVGMQGEYLQISVFCSYSEKRHYRWVLRMLKPLKFSELTVTTTLYSQVKLLSEEKKNLVLIDIGKDYTDIAVMFGKNIVQTSSFEMGGAYFTEYLSDKLKLDYAGANGKKEAYVLGTLPAEESDAIEESLYASGKIWRIALKTILMSMSGIKGFPKDIYLSGGGSLLPVIQELLYEDEWRKSIPFTGDIKISPVKNLWEKYVKDDLNVLSGGQMFIPASLGVIKRELEDTNE